jgi:transcriptional regulator with GAF, ATPase, and Fis domain
MQKEIESVPSAVMKGLTAWEWPGNIRELENFIGRAVILTRGKALEVPLAVLRRSNTDAVLAEKTRTVRKASSSRADIDAGAAQYERKQREEIIQALTACKGRIGGADGAAIRLGIARTTLIYRMEKAWHLREAVFKNSSGFDYEVTVVISSSRRPENTWSKSRLSVEVQAFANRRSFATRSSPNRCD